MARFVFRAEAALDLRRRREDQARQALAQADAAYQDAQRALERADAALRASLAEAAAVHDPARATWYRNWIRRQRQEAALRAAVLAERRAAVDAATASLNGAHRDVRVLERLRDRALAAWRLATARAEQKELDWLGSVQYALRTADASRDGVSVTDEEQGGNQR